MTPERERSERNNERAQQEVLSEGRSVAQQHNKTLAPERKQLLLFSSFVLRVKRKMLHFFQSAVFDADNHFKCF